MTSREISITLLILLTSLLSGSWSCTDFMLPQGCGCDDSGNKGRVKITCGPEATFTSLSPGLFPKHTRELTITPGKILTLSLPDFEGLDKLETLNLDANELTTLDFAALAGLKQLRLLSLQRNKIQNVTNSHQGVLRMNKLRQIRLDSNEISFLGPSSFPDLPNLITVNFKANSIATISRNAFGNVKGKSSISLENNPLQCNCMRGFKSWANRNRVTLHNAVCETGIELPNLEEFGSCSDSGDDSEEPLQCYSCDRTTNEDDCSVQNCDSGQNRCLTETEEVDGVKLITKSCLNADECFTRIAFGTGDKKVTCCPADLCNGKDSGDDSEEPLQCYVCDRTTNEDDCSVLYCDLGQNRCLTETEEVDGVKLITKSCLNADECFTRIAFGTGDKKVTCCPADLCNGKEETVPFCEKETVRNDKGGFVWEKTDVATEDKVICPGDRFKSAVRKCTLEDGVPKWKDPDDDLCPEASEITKELAMLLYTLMYNVVPDENVVDFSMQLENVSKRCPEYNSKDVDHTVNIVQTLLRHGAANQERETIGNCVSALSNLFLTPENRLVGAERSYKSAERYLKVVDELGTLVNLKKSNGSLTEVRPNLAIVSVSINQTDFREISIKAEGQLTTDSSVSLQGANVVSDSMTQIDAITLPSTIFSGFEDKTQAGADRATFVVYQQDTIFKIIDSAARDSERKNNVTRNSTRLDVVNSRILSASIGNLTLRNLTDPVLITFKHQNSTKTPRCVFWDFTNNSWSSNGCKVNKTENDYTVCQCDHLTNFALLLDVYDTQSSQTNQEAVAILNILSFVGCAISFFGLVLTIAIYCIFSKLRKDVPSKILLNLCVALACLNVTFIVGVYSLENPILCKAIAVLMHYFLLSSMAWMSVEAFYMYLALVLVFKTYIQRFMLKAMLMAWGIPLVIVAITLGVNETNNYGSQTNNKICWLTRLSFYVAALAPVALVLLGNMIIFGLVIKQICGMSSQKLNKSETMSALQQLRGIIGVFILLGITWTFAIFAIGEASLVFQYLFTIFNSLQGLFIFIFYCLMKTDVQKRLFCCCPSTFDPSTSSQRSSKATYSTTGRGRSTFRSAINAVFATNIKKRGAYEVAKAVPRDGPMPEMEDYSTSKLNQIELA